MWFWNLAGVSPAALAIASIVMMFGSALQASFGIGLSLVAVPLLTLLDPSFAPGPILLASIGLAGTMAYKGRGAIDPVQLRLSIAGLVIGTAMGAAGRGIVPEAYLPKVFGIVVLVAVGLSLIAVKLPSKRLTLFFGATASGIMGAMAGIHGPAIVLVLQHEDAMRMRATLGAFFVAAYLAAILALALAQGFGDRELALGISLLPGVCLGAVVSSFMLKRLSPRWLRSGVLAISGVSAVLLVLR